MNNSVFFDPVFPLWLIALLVIPFVSFLIWKEVKRKQKFLSLRILAQLFVFISILGILLKPGFFQEKKTSGILLLTPHYSKTLADSLVNSQPDLRILRLPPSDPYRNAEVLSSYQDLTALDNEIQFVLGEGLPEYALDLMDQKNYIFLPATQPPGFVELYLPKKISVNQVNSIQGRVYTSEVTTLTLVGPGGAEDSLLIKGAGTFIFSLKFNPKQPGLFVYSLLYKDKFGLQREQLPLEVTEEKKLTILCLQKFPSFEVRQLKNFIAEKGHRLTLRNQVSKANFQYEFANMHSRRVSPLTSSVLQSFDVVVASGYALEALSAAEKSILEESIRNGLGLVILLDNPAEKDKTRERFLSVKMKKVLKDTVQLNFKTEQYTLPVMPLQISESPSVNVVTKNKNRILSAYSYFGLGKVGFQFLQETYRIALEGNVDDYSSIWSPLFEKTARSKNEKFKIQIKNTFPLYQDEPLHVEVISSVEEHPTLMDDRNPIPLTEHVMIDNTWLGKSWAGKPGWHQFSVDSSNLHYFVSEGSAWKSLRINNQIKENKNGAVNANGIVPPETIQQRKIISPLIFYLLFLIASGFLWLAPKI